MFWKYKLEKWNSLHHPNHRSYFPGLDHLSAPDMLWHLPSCKQIVPRALFSCQHPCSCSLEAKCPGEWSSPSAASSPGSSSNLCTQAVQPSLEIRRHGTSDQQIWSFAFDAPGYSFLLKPFSSLGSWEDSLLIFLHLTGCSFPGFSTGSFSNISETQSHVPDALVFSGSWAIRSRLRAKTPG